MNIAQTGGTSTLTEHGAGNSCYATGGKAIHRVPVEVWQSVLECDQQTPPHLVRLATGRGAAGHGLRHLAKAAKADSLMRRYTPPQFDEALAGDHLLASFVNRIRKDDSGAAAEIRALWELVDGRTRCDSLPSDQELSENRKFFLFYLEKRGARQPCPPDLLIANVAAYGMAEFDPRFADRPSTFGLSALESVDRKFRQQLFMVAVQSTFFYKNQYLSTLTQFEPQLQQNILFWELEQHSSCLEESIIAAFAADIETAISLIRYAPALTKYLRGTKWDLDERVWWAAVSRHDQSGVPCQHVPPSIGARADYVQRLLCVHGAKVHQLVATMPGISRAQLLTCSPEHPGVLGFVDDPAIVQDSQFNAAAIAANPNCYYYLDSDYSRDEATVAAMHAAGLAFTPAAFSAHRHLYRNENLLLSLARKKSLLLPEIISQSNTGAERESIADLLQKNKWFLSAALDLNDYGYRIVRFIASNFDRYARSKLFDRKMELFLGAFDDSGYINIDQDYCDEQLFRVMSYFSTVDIVELFSYIDEADYGTKNRTDIETKKEAFSQLLFADLSYAVHYLREADFAVGDLADSQGYSSTFKFNSLLAGLRDLLDDEDAVLELATMEPRVVWVISHRLVTDDAFFQQLLQVCAKTPASQPIAWQFLAREKPEDLAWLQAKLRDHRFDAPEYEM